MYILSYQENMKEAYRKYATGEKTTNFFIHVSEAEHYRLAENWTKYPEEFADDIDAILTGLALQTRNLIILNEELAEEYYSCKNSREKKTIADAIVKASLLLAENTGDLKFVSKDIDESSRYFGKENELWQLTKPRQKADEFRRNGSAKLAKFATDARYQQKELTY